MWTNTATSYSFVFIFVTLFQEILLQSVSSSELTRKKDAYCLTQTQKKTQFRNTDHVNVYCLGWAITLWWSATQWNRLFREASFQMMLASKDFCLTFTKKQQQQQTTKTPKFSLIVFSTLILKCQTHFILQIILTSFPCFCRNSISCCVNVVIEIDFTLWGGFKPRLKEARSIQHLGNLSPLQACLTLQLEVSFKIRSHLCKALSFLVLPYNLRLCKLLSK